MKKSEITKLTLKASEGLLSTVTNLTLFTFYLVCESVGTSRSSYGVSLTFDAAWEDLDKFNYETIKNALVRLKQKNLVTYQKKTLEKTLQITKEGQKRLKEILPSYKTERTWDGKIYLITYDISENNKNDRDMLRNYLVRLGAGQLQQSVYLIPYNPRLVLDNFIKERNLEAGVIISDLGKDAVIGKETLENLIRRIYQLDLVKKRYQEFIEKYKEGQAKPNEVAFSFLSAVQKDPQLPFELLPKDWPSDRAYKIYKKYLSI